MRIRKKALKAIGEKETRLRLALALDCTEQWIIKCIDANKKNGPLTTASAMACIRKETGLTDSEILEQETESAGKV